MKLSHLLPVMALSQSGCEPQPPTETHVVTQTSLPKADIFELRARAFETLDYACVSSESLQRKVQPGDLIEIEERDRKNCYEPEDVKNDFQDSSRDRLEVLCLSALEDTSQWQLFRDSYPRVHKDDLTAVTLMAHDGPVDRGPEEGRQITWELAVREDGHFDFEFVEGEGFYTRYQVPETLVGMAFDARGELFPDMRISSTFWQGRQAIDVDFEWCTR